MATALSASSANSMLQGSSGMVIGSSLPSPSAAINGPARYYGIISVLQMLFFYICPILIAYYDMDGLLLAGICKDMECRDHHLYQLMNNKECNSIVK